MSGKKKSKPAAAAPTSLDPAAEQAGAAAALQAGRYREAVEQYKDLLKRERRPAWLEGLAAAYAGRAGQLAAKGMVKEALALWRTRAEACQVPLLEGPYVGWLMQTGQTDQALRLWATTDKLALQEREQARTQLAPAVLMAPEPLLAGLPEEILNHRAAARAALAACTAGDDAALALALQAISFRSPYRDLRPLLKALSLAALASPQAAAALAHVPEQGPFEALRRALQVALLPGSEWLAGLRTLGDAGRALVLDLKGCPAAQRPLVLDLLPRDGEAGKAPPQPLELLDLLLRHRRLPGGDGLRPLALRLLPHAPQRLEAFRAGFGSLSADEENQALALAAELKQRHDEAEPPWLRLAKSLGRAPAGQRSAALILRRLADEHKHHGAHGRLCASARNWLAESLKLDPADTTTALRLARDARLSGDLRQARNWLDPARRQFPADTPLLLEAVEVALAAGAFRKAAGLAKELLQIEPLNPLVRSLVGAAHLAHARKLLGTRKRQAAQSELDEAATWLRSAVETARVKLLRGLATEAPAAADALLREAVAELGGPLVGGFQLLLEGQAIEGARGFDAQALLRRAGVDTSATPAAADVLAFARFLQAAPENDATLQAKLGAEGRTGATSAASRAIGGLQALFERALARARFSESDFLLICEALHRHGPPTLSRRYAEAALAQWPERPAFIYYEAAARYGDAPRRIPDEEWDRLDLVYEQALEQDDMGTATRLGELLDLAAPDYDDDEDDGDGPDTEAAAITAFIDRMLAEGGEDKFLEMARQRLGKSLFEQIRREVNGTKKQFAHALAEIMIESARSPDPVRIGPPAGRQADKASPARPARQGRKSATTKRQPDLFDD